MGRRYRKGDPTANTAIGNVTRQGKLKPRREKTRRRIVEEFPDIFADLNQAERMTVTLAAARIANTGDAFAIRREHLEAAKTNHLQDAS